MAEQMRPAGPRKRAARAKESSDYHLTTNKHAQTAEDELDRKEETSRRIGCRRQGAEEGRPSRR